MDPRTQLIPEPGFEMYERGSFGHGCEKARFGIKRKQVKEDISQADHSKLPNNYLPDKKLLFIYCSKLWQNKTTESREDFVDFL